MRIDLALIAREFALKLIEALQKSIRETSATQYGAMNNTGEAANSLRYRWEGDKLTIYSDMNRDFNYILTLETGRKPGKMPPTEPIKQWIEQRGIQPPDISQDSLAFLIARKIGREGSLVYRQGGNSGVLMDVLKNEQFFQEFLYEPIKKALATNLVSA